MPPMLESVTTPRSGRKRRPQNGREPLSPPPSSINRAMRGVNGLSIPQTPLTSPIKAKAPRRSHSDITTTTTITPTNQDVATSPDPLASQILALYNHIDDLTESLSRSYDEERRARKEAYESTQRQLGGIQELLAALAADHARMRRRERMGMLELGLFGAEGVVSPVRHTNNIGAEGESYTEAEGESMTYAEEESTTEAGGEEMVEDVNMEDIDDTQSEELGLDEGLVTTGRPIAPRPGPGPGIIEYLDDEDDDEETEDDSMPVARIRQRRHVSQTISPTRQLQEADDGDLTESDAGGEPAGERESDTYSLKALTQSLQNGTRPKRKPAQTSVPNGFQGFSQYTIPPNPQEEDDETYRESPYSTPEREVETTVHPTREISVDLEYDLSLPKKQRPQRKSAQVDNYYKWDRYIHGGRVPVVPTPEQNDKRRHSLNGSTSKQARKGGRSKESSPGLENPGSRVVGGKNKHGKRPSVDLGESSGEEIVVKTRKT